MFYLQGKKRRNSAGGSAGGQGGGVSGGVGGGKGARGRTTSNQRVNNTDITSPVIQQRVLAPRVEIGD